MARSRLSILSNATTADIHAEPYPHIIVHNALDPDLFERLQQQYPPPAVVLDGRPVTDTWYDYPACKVLNDQRVTPLWREFFGYHVSQDFFLDVVDLFGPLLRALHPDLEDRLGRPLYELETSMRQSGGKDNPHNCEMDASLECQFYINYTRHPRAVRGPHVDRTTELYAGLLYLRDEADDSVGSDLEICQARNARLMYPKDNRIRIARLPAELRKEDVETIRTARYAANTLVFFLNSPKSIHAVSPRSATSIPRRHINFCADLFKAPNGGLFVYDLPLQKHLKLWLQKTPIAWRLAPYIAD